MSDIKEMKLEDVSRMWGLNQDDLRDQVWNRVTKSFQISQGSFRAQSVVGGGAHRSKKTVQSARSIRAPLQDIVVWKWEPRSLPCGKTAAADVQSDDEAEIEAGGFLARVLQQFDKWLLEDVSEQDLPRFPGDFDQWFRLQMGKHWRRFENDDILVYPAVEKDIERRESFWFDSARCPALNSQELLGELLSPEVAHDRRRQLIIEVEAVQIPDSDVERILPLLREFIEQHRNSNDPSDAVAVTSAIRSYIAEIPVERTGELVTFLETGHRVSVPIDVELEIAKMIYRKFEANPPAESNPEPALAERLADRARSYLNPHVFPRDRYYAAVAMNACQALAAMRSELTADVFSFVRQYSVGWFTQQLVCRLEKQLAGRWVGNEEALEGLAAMIRILRETPSEENAC